MCSRKLVVIAICLVVTGASASESIRTFAARTIVHPAMAAEPSSDQVAELQKKAAAGDANAQAKLGWLYSQGKGVPYSQADAAIWFRKAAEQGNAFAQYQLSGLYETGWGVPLDSGEAEKWLQLALAQGEPHAQDARGLRSYDTKDYVEAAKWFRKAADQGDSNAQELLGKMYAEGDGVPQDLAEAEKWFRKAAELGRVDMQQRLGMRYYNGDGVPQNFEESYAWLSVAALRGNDPDKEYFAKEASKTRDEIAKIFTPEQLNKAQQRAQEYFKEYGKDPAPPFE